MKLALDTNAYKALGEGDPLLVAVALPIVVLGELCDRGFKHVLWLDVVEVSSPDQP